MLPKERMLAAMEHREGDRVPVGELASDFEMTERVLGHPTYYRSKWREYKAEWEGRREDVAASYSRDIVDLARTLEWDFLVVPLVPARRHVCPKPEMLGEYRWRDASGKVWQYSPDSGGHAMLIEAPPMNVADIVLPKDFQVDESRLEAIAAAVRALGDTHFVVGRLPECTFPWDLTIGMEDFLMRMITQREFVQRATEAAVRQGEAWAAAMCDLGVDAVIECTDYCDNFGPMMGPKLFREFILPGIRRLGKVAHSKGKYFLKHTDGNTWAILDDMIAAGIDGWQGIQPSIGMDLKALKEKYCGKLCLFGGVNNETLIAGTPAEVMEEVEYAFRYAAPGGGYVLASGNTLQIGTKYENYVAMRKAARQFGTYPIVLPEVNCPGRPLSPVRPTDS